jgi:hypothetical protein
MAEGFDNRPNIAQSLTDNALSNISGILSTRPTAKYLSGARCILKINGNVCAFAFGISWRIVTNYVEINTIDNYEPVELAPQRVTVEGTISALRIPGESPTAQLWQSHRLSFLFDSYIDIEVRDSQTDLIIFKANKAIITSRSEDIKVDQLANVSLTWKAVGFMDEAKPTLPVTTEENETAIKKALKQLEVMFPNTNK